MTSSKMFSRFAVFAMVLALVAAACSKKDDAGSDNDGESRTGELTIEDQLAGTFSEPPSEAPKPAKNKKVTVISCGELLPSCSVPSAAAIDAGEQLGWEMTLKDTNADFAKGADLIREAVNEGADALILEAVDCGPTKEALKEAKDAGVLTSAFYAFDCSDPNYDSEEPLFDSEIIVGDGSYSDYAEFNLTLGEAKTNWLIEQLDGKAKILTIDQTEVLVSKYLLDGVKNAVDNCEECELVEVIKMTAPEIGNLESKITSALSANPEINGVVINIDLHSTFGGGGFRESGRLDELVMIGAEGYEASLQQLRDGELEAIAGFSGEWAAWAAVDGLVRLFAGEKAQPSGIGWQIVLSDDAPSGDVFEPEIDFKSIYKKAWGI